MNDGEVDGARILVVEDRGMIADKVQRTLAVAGFRVVAVLPTLLAATEWIGANGDRLDAAVLDIDLRGVPAYPLADMLARRGTPFLFLTGYGQMVIDARWRDRLRVEKPFEAATLAQAVRAALAGERAPVPVREPVLTDAVHRAWDTMRETRNIITESRCFRESHDLGGHRE